MELWRKIELVLHDFGVYLGRETGFPWKHNSSNVSWFIFTAQPKFHSVGIPGWGGGSVGFDLRIQFKPRWFIDFKTLDEADAGVADVYLFDREGRETFSEKVSFGDLRNPASSSHVRRLIRLIKESAVSDQKLRASLIRLAHTHPEFRADLLPLLKEGCGHDIEAPATAKFEEGKPADPTENMSPEDAKKWWSEHEKNKNQFKGAGCEKLPEGGMRENCEEKQETSKTAGMVAVRRMVTIAVRVLRYSDAPGGLDVSGQMSIDFGDFHKPDAVRFSAIVSKAGDQYTVRTFTPLRSVSGAGAEIILGVLRSALQEALQVKGEQLLGDATWTVPEPSV